jgi:hypothetical protein
MHTVRGQLFCILKPWSDSKLSPEIKITCYEGKIVTLVMYCPQDLDVLLLGSVGLCEARRIEASTSCVCVSS